MKQKLCFGGGFPTLLLCNGVESTGKTCDALGEFSGQHCIESVLAGDLGHFGHGLGGESLAVGETGLYLKGIAGLGIFAKHSGCGDFIILTCGDGGGSLQNVIKPGDSGAFESETQIGVLYNAVFNTGLTELTAELCVVLDVDSLILNDNTCAGLFKLFGQIADELFLLFENCCTGHIIHLPL